MRDSDQEPEATALMPRVHGCTRAALVNLAPEPNLLALDMLGRDVRMPRAQGEAERGERPVNVHPAERASHGRRAPGLSSRAGRESEESTGAALVGLNPERDLLATSGAHRELANNTTIQA